MFGSLGDQQGQLQKPTGCDLNINTGELFIVEWQGERLQIFDYSHLLSKSGLIYFRNKLFKNIGKLSDIIVETRE
ncbi:hypothetical protein C9374_006363 [Naegleria lovaniensis]|uniref:Uncharacterized protein n=1 Tax=Naegleria lovaniensis TaxID=51637 RepID=A0AA88GI25_NAELO|nr:uncharacterized protein C9374_006363 [Naegleria lovaniensis]KAG2381374.1 hypothetical protein C9374_006363 [Naegleria lovaniensis]